MTSLCDLLQWSQCNASSIGVSTVAHHPMLIAMSNQSLPELVARRIDELGTSQRKYAERIGTSQTWVNQMLQGRITLPSADVRRRLARDLGISHLDVLVASGEITRDEVEHGGVLSRDPVAGVPSSIVETLRRMRWDDDITSFMQITIDASVKLIQTRKTLDHIEQVDAIDQVDSIEKED